MKKLPLFYYIIVYMCEIYKIDSIKIGGLILRTLGEKDIKGIVKDSYGEIAKSQISIYNKEVSESVGYSKDDISEVPTEANLGLGCGNPLIEANICKGETVLDLGSGAGFDCFLAANKVGESGVVIGIDMTQEMIEQARKNAISNDYENVEFILSEIENLPIEDNKVDVIISNCVINLSCNKQKVYDEAYRVLKKGGRIAISDIVLMKSLTEEMKKDEKLYCA